MSDRYNISQHFIKLYILKGNHNGKWDEFVIAQDISNIIRKEITTA